MRAGGGFVDESLTTYRVPYLPLRRTLAKASKTKCRRCYTYVTPTFFVRLVILADLCGRLSWGKRTTSWRAGEITLRLRLRPPKMCWGRAANCDFP